MKLEKKVTRAINRYHKTSGVCIICGENMGKDFHELLEWYAQRMGLMTPRTSFNRAIKKRTNININTDHVIPLSRAGSDNSGNKVFAHMDCNVKKGNRLPEELINHDTKTVLQKV